MFNDNAQLLQPRRTMVMKKSYNLIGAGLYGTAEQLHVLQVIGSSPPPRKGLAPQD